MGDVRRIAFALMLAALPLATTACSGGGQSGDAVAKKEDPAEQGAAEIQRKADEAVKAKVADFDAKMKQQQEAAGQPPATSNATTREATTPQSSEKK